MALPGASGNDPIWLTSAREPLKYNGSRALCLFRISALQHAFLKKHAATDGIVPSGLPVSVDISYNSRKEDRTIPACDNKHKWAIQHKINFIIRVSFLFRKGKLCICRSRYTMFVNLNHGSMFSFTQI